MVREAVLQVMEDMYNPRMAAMKQVIKGLMISMTEREQREGVNRQEVVERVNREEQPQDYYY